MEPTMSSFVSAAPDVLASASADLSKIGEALKQATSLAGPSAAAIAPLAGDEVSAAVTALFGSYGEEFQALSAQSSSFHAEFASLLQSGANSYSAVETANAALTGLVGVGQHFAVF